MINLKTTYANILHPRLAKIARQSAEKMTRYKEENVFQTKIMRELFSDKFEYKGTDPRVLVKDRLTGEPVELAVEFMQETYLPKQHIIMEHCNLRDIKNDKIVGRKYYCLKKHDNGKFTMYEGEMSNTSPNLAGVGIRMDQMQIERAIGLGIEKIPRTSESCAVAYHTKVGFLPVERDLEHIQTMQDLKKHLVTDFKKYDGNIPLSYFKPIIINKDGDFYIDVNKTLATVAVERTKEILNETKQPRLWDLSNFYVFMSLKGDELIHWKKIIEKHPVFAKWGQVFNNNF